MAENVLAVLSIILVMVDDVGIVERAVGKVDARLNGGALKRCFCNKSVFFGIKIRNSDLGGAFVVVMLWTG